MGEGRAAAPGSTPGDAAPTLRIEPAEPSGALPDDLLAAAARVLAARDIIAETAAHLDGWAEAAGLVEATTVDGTSYWFYSRLRHWMWLHDRVLWSAILDDLIGRVRPGAIDCAPGVDRGVVDVARDAAARDGLAFRAEGEADAGAGGSGPDDDADEPPEPAAPAPAVRPSLAVRATRRLRRLVPGGPVDARGADRQRVLARLDALAAQPGRLLVVLAHARQRVETGSGPRLVNAYLDPITDRLRGTALDPVELDLSIRLTDAGWERFEEPGADHLLPTDTLGFVGSGGDVEEIPARVEAIAQRIAGSSAPLVVDRVDLGPLMARRAADEVRRSLAGKIRTYGRIRRLLRRLRPAGVLLAVEYHRQEWLAAAHAEGIASAAVQHGLIYRWHNGYMHATRPSGLRLPDRTYVFGDWERRLLTTTSVYRDGEVAVGGSPRLDLVGRVDGPARRDRDAVRAELGIAPGDRMVVLSGTWGPMYRQFYFPIALASLFDRPMPRVHLVVKLHPNERDEGPYRAVVEGAARAGGFAPPPISVVQAVDLYRLLAAADAHLGIHSTVLTEAVVTGTPNLLAAMFRGADLLGYVDAGVATPVRTGADVLAALDHAPDPAVAAAARAAFLDDHFAPGSASERIAADLLGWLA